MKPFEIVEPGTQELEALEAMTSSAGWHVLSKFYLVPHMESLFKRIGIGESKTADELVMQVQVLRGEIRALRSLGGWLERQCQRLLKLQRNTTADTP